MHILWIVGVVVLVAALALGAEALCAYVETRTAPRVDHFTCDKHGAFPAKWLLELDLGDGGPPFKQCPFCWDASMKKAEAYLKTKAGAGAKQ